MNSFSDFIPIATQQSNLMLAIMTVPRYKISIVTEKPLKTFTFAISRKIPKQ